MSAFYKMISKDKNLTPIKLIDEKSEGKMTNQDSLHFNTSPNNIYYKTVYSETSKTHNFFMALNTLQISYDKINEKEIFDNINEYSQTNPNQTKDYNITKYIHRPLVKEFIKKGNELKIFKPIKMFGASINNLYSFNYNLQIVFEKLKYKKNRKFLNLNLALKNKSKKKIINNNELKRNKILDNIFPKNQKNIYSKGKFLNKICNKNERDNLYKKSNNLNKQKNGNSLDNNKFIKEQDYKNKINIAEKNKINPKHPIQMPLERKNLKIKIFDTEIKEKNIDIKARINNIIENNIKIININKNNCSKNNINNIDEITTVKDEYNGSNIVMNSYNKNKEQSSYETKDNIAKNLLNNFNSCSSLINSDSSFF